MVHFGENMRLPEPLPPSFIPSTLWIPFLILVQSQSFLWPDSSATSYKTLHNSFQPGKKKNLTLNSRIQQVPIQYLLGPVLGAGDAGENIISVLLLNVQSVILLMFISIQSCHLYLFSFLLRWKVYLYLLGISM